VDQDGHGQHDYGRILNPNQRRCGLKNSASLALAWRVLCALTAHKPAHGHGHYSVYRGPDVLFATKVTQRLLYNHCNVAIILIYKAHTKDALRSLHCFEDKEKGYNQNERAK
jgi:hypothetical protein